MSTSEFTTKALGGIARFEYGKSQAAVRSTDGKIPVYGTGGLMEFANAALHPGPSVIIGRKGSLGRPIFSEGPFWAVDTTYYVAEFSGDIRWLYYLLCSLRLETLNEATGVPSLARPTLNKVKIHHPNPGTQTAIANVLGTADRAMEQTEALLAKQQRIKAGLMHDLLTRGLDAQGRLRDPAKHRFRPSVLGHIPEEWKVCPLANIVPPDRPIVYGILMPGDYVEGGVPVIKVRDIQNGEIIMEGLLRTHPKIDAAFARSRLRVGDLLFTIRGSVGRMAVVSAELNGANITQDTARITVSEGNTTFIRHCLEMPKQKALIELHTIGQAVKGINLSEVRKIPIQFPRPDEQDEIARRLDANDRDRQALRRQLDKLLRQKTGLMQDLLTGRVPVTPLLSANPT